MSKTLVAVIRGGPSSEYEVSLKTGAQVLKSLPDHYEKRDIFISKDGQWHYGGFPMKPQKALDHVNVVFNAMHGEYGEDGKVQKLLDSIGVPYTGSDSITSALVMNKHLTKEVYRKAGIQTPRHILIKSLKNADEQADTIFRNFHMPVVVKAVALGSSVGILLVTKYTDLAGALRKVADISNTIMIEEYISGREATCGVIDAFRGEEHYVPLPVEIIHPKNRNFFDYEAKYGGDSLEICPPTFSEHIKQEIITMARKAHQVLGVRHYSRSDFRISPTGKVYILETNTLPGLTPESLLPKSLAAVGCTLPQFLDHVVGLALVQK